MTFVHNKQCSVKWCVTARLVLRVYNAHTAANHWTAFAYTWHAHAVLSPLTSLAVKTFCSKLFVYYFGITLKLLSFCNCWKNVIDAVHSEGNQNFTERKSGDRHVRIWTGLTRNNMSWHDMSHCVISLSSKVEFEPYRKSFRQMSQIVGLAKLAITNSWFPALAYGGQILSLQRINRHEPCTAFQIG